MKTWLSPQESERELAPASGAAMKKNVAPQKTLIGGAAPSQWRGGASDGAAPGAFI
jgi:hypothetical protein